VFVKTNTIKAVKAYFKERLIGFFTESEIKFMLKEAVIERLKLSSSEYLLCDEQLLSESDLLFFRSIVKRLLNNEPFQYVIGKTEFFGLEIKTDKRALIPRPETEELVQWVSESIQKDQTYQIADICTGSGCIALGLRSYFENSIITATDFSLDALELTKENSANLNLPLTILQIDATTSNEFELPINSFDCWVSNPPYIPINDKIKMEKNVLEFEPEMALFVENEDPLLFYREIGKNALVHLKPAGLLFFELHEDLAKETMQLIMGLGFVNIELRKDLQGKDRMLKAQKP
jgi:release factor glutamine methyltransferase